MKQGDVIRSIDGQARVEFDPAWSPTKPYKTFTYGTAGIHFPTLSGALQRLRNEGFRFDKKDIT